MDTIKKYVLIIGMLLFSFQALAQTDKLLTFEITQPATAVSLNLVNIKNTSAFGFTDGSITVDVAGGTPFSGGIYSFEWRDSAGNLVTSTTTQNVASGYRITLNTIPSDTYTLTVTDANYNTATTTTGCTYQNSYLIEEPSALSLTLQETSSISCNGSNTFGDPFSDGELTALASGGIAFDPLIDGFYGYIYTWKKKDVGGIWQTLTGITGNTASNLVAGEYAVNIEDANGIIVGTYTNNVLTAATGVTYILNEPNLLQITLAKTDVFCNTGNDGSVQSTVTGGTGNYTILWNNGSSTQNQSNLVAGIYTIEVIDKKGCQAEATIEITEPENPLEISYTSFAPTFAGATDGWIEATITGGSPLDDGSYTFLWEDSTNTNLADQITTQVNAGSYVLTLNNVGADMYYLTIEDKNYLLATTNTNCTIINSDFLLEDPEPLSVVIQEQTPISCNSTNIYGDPYSDGVLIAIADGGVQLQPTDNNGLLYYYTWKKEVGGVWQVLTNQTTNIASGLNAGNYAVNIEDANGIIIGTYVNNILDTATDVTYLFDEPILLELTINQQDVYCNGGSDGWAEVIITGGTPPYTISWSNGDTIVLASDLLAGTYVVAITDSKGCQADGSVSITEPQNPINIDYTAFIRPSTAGASDGWIEAQATGGTALGDGSYTYIWTDENGTSLNTQTTTSFVGAVNDIFQIRLNGVPSGTYYLTIEDANFNTATNQGGCTFIESPFILYEPIEATIAVYLPISCHQDNSFENPFSDGVLIASVQGGIPFATGQPYIYYWKKQDASGNYIDLPAQTSDIAADLSDGNYALNVEDSLGNVIGIYQSNTLIQASDALFTLNEPDLLEVSLNSTPISCGAGNDGTATVTITGGTGNYTIGWSNGVTTSTITNLIAGNYIVYVTDEMGCEAMGQITVEQPGGLKIAIIGQIHPTCDQGGDGSISVEVTGGQTPYTYLWNTGETGSSINGLFEGTYTFQITDVNGCIAFKDIVLEDPDPVIVNLGDDRTLCNGQVQELDITINDTSATYLWTSDNGFRSSSSMVSLTEAGLYTVTLTTGLGCTGTDTINITTSTAEIDSEFLITSQSFAEEEVILVNTSNPISTVVDWILPDQAQVVEETNETITLRFDTEGAYQVTLRSFQGDCYKDYTKPIVVKQARDLPDIGDADSPFIQEFKTYPNPTTDMFTVSIILAEEATVSLRLFNLVSNIPLDDRQRQGASEYDINYQLNLSSGIYFLLLETAKGSEIRKVLVE